MRIPGKGDPPAAPGAAPAAQRRSPGHRRGILQESAELDPNSEGFSPVGRHRLAGPGSTAESSLRLCCAQVIERRRGEIVLLCLQRC